MPKTRIYALSDPFTDQIMYVGKTIQTLRQRLSMHIHCAKHDSTPRDIWIASLLLKNKKPIISLIEDVPEEIWREKEIYWIAYYKKQNPFLTNISTGGHGPNGVKRKEENLRNIAQAKSKKIYQLDKNLNIINEYFSCKEAKISTGIKHINSAVRKNNKKTAGGYIWVYKEDYENLLKNPIKTHFTLDRTSYYKKVKMYNKENILLNTFDSVKEASEKTGISYRRICNAAGGYKKSCGGYIWKYENEILYKRKK